MSRILRHRHFWPISIAVVTVALTVGTFPAYAAWTQQFHGGTTPTATSTVVDESKPHSHNDPATKNSISRAALASGTSDPTTALESFAGMTAVEAQRLEADPTLIKTPSPAARAAVPKDRYAMAGGCYALQSTSNGKWVTKAGLGYSASTPRSPTKSFAVPS